MTILPMQGADKVWRLAEDGAPGAWKIQGSIDQPQGSGPRHAVIQGKFPFPHNQLTILPDLSLLPDNTLFTLHELDNTLTAQSIGPAPNGTSVTLASISIVPTDSGVPAGAKFAAAEILMPSPSSSFPSSFIYASNRNTGTPDPRGDSIAIVQFVSIAGRTAEFRIVNQVFTGLQQIRGMAFSDDGQFLVAAGSQSGGVKVFERTDGGEGLTEVAKNDDVDTRSSFVWV
jgi:6-phosphogluconolactonase (cycloisomerase 2 family)